MLSDEEKARIRQEEEARLHILKAQQEEEARQRAAAQFRQEIQNEMHETLLPAPRKKPVPLRPVALLVVVVVGVLITWRLSHPASPLDPSLLAFVQQCEVRLQTDCQCTPHFVADPQAVKQVVEQGEDRSWQGHYTSDNGSEKDFLCSGSPTSDEVHVEIFQEDL